MRTFLRRRLKKLSKGKRKGKKKRGGMDMSGIEGTAKSPVYHKGKFKSGHPISGKDIQRLLPDLDLGPMESVKNPQLSVPPEQRKYMQPFLDETIRRGKIEKMHTRRKSKLQRRRSPSPDKVSLSPSVSKPDPPRASVAMRERNTKIFKTIEKASLKRKKRRKSRPKTMKV